MARPSKTEQEYGYLRSAWDEIRGMQADYQGVVSIYANATGRPGVFTIRLVFTPLVEDAENYLGANAVQYEYPNGTTQTMASALWAQAMKLTECVSASYQALKPRRNRRG
jgi:hypothetical protein